MIDLNNDLTLQFDQLTFDFKNQAVIMIFTLRPTLGTLVQNQADKYLEYNLQFYYYNTNDQSIILALKDLNKAGVEAWITADYTTWLGETQENQQAWHPQLLNLYNYINTVGIKP